MSDNIPGCRERTSYLFVDVKIVLGIFVLGEVKAKQISRFLIKFALSAKSKE